MKNKFCIVAAFILASTFGCKNLVDKVVQEQGIKVHQGYNKNGKLASCVTTNNSLNQPCTEIFGPDEQFAESCKKSGAEVATCGCHSYLCSQKIEDGDATPEPDPTEGLVLYKGYNSNGVKTECSVDPKANLICDASFGPGDQYAADCREKGYKALQCGCHAYLCSGAIKKPVPLPAPKPEPEEPIDGKNTYNGFDKDGKARSCTVESGGSMICTMVFTPGDQFGADCRAKGHKAYMCGCHDYICSKPLTSTSVPVPSEDKITYNGYDMSGTMTTCTVTPGMTVMCMTAPPGAEKYRQECKAKGGQVSACYCQNYLCSKKIPFTR